MWDRIKSLLGSPIATLCLSIWAEREPTDPVMATSGLMLLGQCLALKVYPWDSCQHGCQMAIAKFLDCMCLALRARRTTAQLPYAAKFDPFLSLDCARVEGG